MHVWEKGVDLTVCMCVSERVSVRPGGPRSS